MNVIVEARHMEVTDSMRSYVESKVSKLPRLYDGVQTIEAILDMEKDDSVAEVIVKAAKKHTFVAKARNEDMYAALDQCMDKISTQLRRFKDKVRDRQVDVRKEPLE